MANHSISLSFENESAISNQTTSPSMLHESTWDTFDTGNFLVNCVITPPILTIGILGNIVSVLVFRRDKRRGASTIFIIGLALSDLFFVLTTLLITVYSICHEFFPEQIRYVIPNALFWRVVAIVPLRCGPFFITAITLERLTAVWYPLHLRGIWTRRVAFRISLVIVVLNVLIWAAEFYEYAIFMTEEDIPKSGRISVQLQTARYLVVQSLYSKVIKLVSKIFLDLLPVLVVTTLNIMILLGVKRNNKMAKHLMTSVTSRQKLEQKLTRMLLTISFIYCILCGPHHFYLFLIIKGTIRPTDLPFLVTETMKKLTVMNSCINFIIYGITDREVRGKYKEMFLYRPLHCNNCSYSKSSKEESMETDLSLRRY